MIGNKYIILVLNFFTFLLFITAIKNECGENVDKIKAEALQFLNYTLPLRYQIYVDPCITSGNFSAYVNIDLLILKETKNISLHALQLDFCKKGVYLINKGSLNETFDALEPVNYLENQGESFSYSEEILDDSSEALQPTGFVYYEKEESVTIQFGEYLKPGRYALEIRYMGVINFEAVGIYRKSYKNIDGENRFILLSNLFPTSARRIFPSRDEPAIKAELYFTMQTSLNYTTITATIPTNRIDFKEGQRWTRYHPNVKVSTYQLNFAVLNNMKNLTRFHANKTYIMYASESDLKSVRLTQDIHEKAMNIMENYTKIRYPLNTFTSLIIPGKSDVTPSATLGFLTIKKSQALFNDKLGPQKRKDVVLRASKDIANQWFNQLISPSSWKYMWLTEGLTEFMKYYVANKIMPSWRLKDMFVVWELQRRAFIPNKITDGPPLNKNISSNPKDIQCLSVRIPSSTSMSASLIRMMSHFLSEKVLRSGIVHFLKNNKHSSVQPYEFWRSVQKAVNNSKMHSTINASVTEIMESWINTEFYPILNISRNYTSGLIKVSQIPAVTFFNLTQKNITHEWWIPINYATQSQPNFNVTLPSHWLKPNQSSLNIDTIHPNDWIVFNIQQTGYYRVLYDTENWKRLASYLNSENYLKISPINRAQIINDALQFSLKGHLDVNIFFDLLSYLRQETDYIPWYDAQFIFSFLNYHLSNTEAYVNLKKFGLNLIIPLVDKIGYEDRPEDDFSTLLLRRISNHWACYFEYEKCWNNATKQLQAYLNNKKLKLSSIDLQEWARCVGLNGASETVWNKMFKKYQENFSQDTLIYLACSHNLTILHNYLNITTSKESIIPQNQVLSVFKSVCLYPAGDDKRINLCLNIIDDNFYQIQSRLGNTTENFTHLLDLIASEIRQKNQLEKFQTILAKEQLAFAASKLNARIKQTEIRISDFEQKANYYNPFLKNILSKMHL